VYIKISNLKSKIFFKTIVILLPFASSAQRINWQNLDLVKDSCLGISTNKAYAELLKGKKSIKVIVGIIDSGIDTAQQDLKPVLWTDAKTGIHGWNYIGAETGREDITKLVGYNKDLYDSLAYTMVPESYRAGYQTHRRLTPQLEGKTSAMKELQSELEGVNQTIDSILKKMGIQNPGLEDFKKYKPANENEQTIIKSIVNRLPLYNDWQKYRDQEIIQIITKVKFHLGHGLNLENNEADTATGDADISPDKLGAVKNPNLTAWHGTHVAGIIAAKRNNQMGMDGIADNAEVMMLKTNGTIRELRDESLAKAIRFAVDHGAKIINLSFGKPYTWDKKDVDGAVKYAMLHDVLLLHAAGNAGENLDAEEHYPNPNYLSGGCAQAWIEVGASGWKDDAALAAPFSNYGKKDVDVFAPGERIYSTLPDNQYASWDGTSMATPVVAGLAALIREYYPKLTAIQVKDIIMKSVVKRDILKDKCVSGGVVNAYNALKLAATYK